MGMPRLIFLGFERTLSSYKKLSSTVPLFFKLIFTIISQRILAHGEIRLHFLSSSRQSCQTYLLDSSVNGSVSLAKLAPLVRHRTSSLVNIDVKTTSKRLSPRLPVQKSPALSPQQRKVSRVPLLGNLLHWSVCLARVALAIFPSLVDLNGDTAARQQKRLFLSCPSSCAPPHAFRPIDRS